MRLQAIKENGDERKNQLDDFKKEMLETLRADPQIRKNGSASQNEIDTTCTTPRMTRQRNRNTEKNRKKTNANHRTAVAKRKSSTARVSTTTSLS